jgi:hypothetical protein
MLDRKLELSHLCCNAISFEPAHVVVETSLENNRDPPFFDTSDGDSIYDLVEPKENDTLTGGCMITHGLGLLRHWRACGITVFLSFPSVYLD